MTQYDDIFNDIYYVDTKNIYSNIGLFLDIYCADPIQIIYNEMDIKTIEEFIEKANNRIDCSLLLPVHQYDKDFFSILIIEKRILSVEAYEGKEHLIDVFESNIDLQFPILKKICDSIINSEHDISI